MRARPRSSYVADLIGINLVRGVLRDGVIELPGNQRIAVVEDAVPSGPVTATIRPRAITIHGSQPAGSARNVWPTTIDDLDDEGDRIRVRVGAPVPLVVEITPSARVELALRPGSPVWISFKATEVVIQADSDRGFGGLLGPPAGEWSERPIPPTGRDRHDLRSHAQWLPAARQGSPGGSNAQVEAARQRIADGLMPSPPSPRPSDGAAGAERMPAAAYGLHDATSETRAVVPRSARASNLSTRQRLQRFRREDRRTWSVWPRACRCSPAPRVGARDVAVGVGAAGAVRIRIACALSGRVRQRARRPRGVAR